jgi:hypothetical protein
MRAPMSENIRSILTDTRKSKTLSGQILLSNRLGLDPVIRVNGKKIKLVRVSPLGKSFTKKP